MPIGWKGLLHKSLDIALLWQKLFPTVLVLNIKESLGKNCFSIVCGRNQARLNGEAGSPIASVPVSAKPIQPFMAAYCSVGPVHSGRCLKIVSIKIQLGSSGQVVHVCRLEFVTVVFNEVGWHYCRNHNSDHVMGFFVILSIGLPDCLDRLDQFTQASSLNFSHEIVCVNACSVMTAFGVDHFPL